VNYDAGDVSNEICFSCIPIGTEVAPSAIVFLGKLTYKVPLEALSRACSDVKKTASNLDGPSRSASEA
jgi:hypothetical protein